MKHISDLLRRFFDDGRLDQDEKSLLKQLGLASRSDELSYMRNQAFDIAEQKIAEGLNAAMALAMLKKVVKLINATQLSMSGKEPIVCFSPGTSCRDTIIDLLNKAKDRVDICVFTISDDNITQAIIAAYDRGVPLRVISDNDKSNDLGSDIDRLQQHGVAVVMDKSKHHMHHKFAIIDQQLINGSFNWTRSATQKNQENITVNNGQTLVQLFADKFDDLWQNYS